MRSHDVGLSLEAFVKRARARVVGAAGRVFVHKEGEDLYYYTCAYVVHCKKGYIIR